jgi:hypothetical protein
MAFEKDLVVVVPDGAIHNAVTTLLEKRRSSLRLREITFDVLKDALHDSSPEAQAVELLRGFFRSHERAMVLRDFAGSGWESRGVRALEDRLTEALAANGWSRDRVVAIAIDPELEIWLRLDSPHLQALVTERARRNANQTGLPFKQHVQVAVQRCGGAIRGKPRRPKESFEAILEHFGIPRSNALYRELAMKESLEGCVVSSFKTFVAKLQQWFPDRPPSAASP